ncbi:MAG: hypothetical protein JF606_11660 [Burkholderiales bacterium]|jgi:hypothetical protein|nr:hypothetical protein [Burkholderiales bacterium]
MIEKLSASEAASEATAAGSGAVKIVSHNRQRSPLHSVNRRAEPETFCGLDRCLRRHVVSNL